MFDVVWRDTEIVGSRSRSIKLSTLLYYHLRRKINSARNYLEGESEEILPTTIVLSAPPSVLINRRYF